MTVPSSGTTKSGDQLTPLNIHAAGSSTIQKTLKFVTGKSIFNFSKITCHTKVLIIVCGKLINFDDIYLTYFCSWVIVPGTAILPTGLLAIAYCLTLIYLFLGISIVSDIFMS
jgi:type IV secretory pathway TrbL component